MVTTKVVDALVETWHHRHGVDLYHNAAHLGLATFSTLVVPVYCGRDAFDEWQSRFVALARRKNPATIDAFYEQTEVLRQRNREPECDGFSR